MMKDRDETLVIVRAKEFDRASEPESLLDFFQSAAGGRDLDLKRKRDSTREIEIFSTRTSFQS